MHISDILAGTLPSALSEYVLHPFITIMLCLLSVFVVLGNLLVVTAIWHENQLHSVTNYLIASLAAADCLVGAVVMPFSIISEIILGSWTFGAVWCDLWHSFDVLASTASIMNLCAISLDRYLAITNPISYPTKMTPKRVALLIVSLWTCSSLISFPAIIWWHAVGQMPLQRLTPHPPQIPPSLQVQQQSTTPSQISSTSSKSSELINFSTTEDQEAPLYKCVFPDDTYYLLFSSFISFYGPLCIMLYAYYRIYTAAVQQTRFLKYGSKQVIIGKNKKSKRFRHISDHSISGANDRFGLNEGTNCESTTETSNRQHLVLRAHRGGGGGNSSIKALNGDMTRSGNLGEQKRKDENHHGNGNSSLKMLSLDCSRDHIQSSGINDDVHKSRLCGNEFRPVNALNRNRSIGSTSDRRSYEGRNQLRNNSDKLRKDQQRFDPNPISEQVDLTKTNYNQAEPKYHTTDLDHTLGDTSSTSVDVRLSSNPYVEDLQVDSRQHHHMGKPLMASINNHSTSVDVSIMDRCKLPMDFVSARTKKSRTYSLFTLSTSRNYNTPKGKDLIILRNSSVQKSENEKGNPVRAHTVVVDDDLISDDLFEGESVCTTSGSYGTGSIASVLLRPQQKTVAPATEAKSSVEESCGEKGCDSVGLSNQKTGRDLSVGDGKQNSSDHLEENPSQARGKLTLDTWHYQEQPSNSDHHQVRPLTLEIKSSDEGCSSNKNEPNSRPQSKISAGSPLLSDRKLSDVIGTGLKTARAMDIRSWVKISRSRSRTKNNAINNPAEKFVSMKPPPSLMPLMMMNSDTSTDSSVFASNVKKMGALEDNSGEDDGTDESDSDLDRDNLFVSNYQQADTGNSKTSRNNLSSRGKLAKDLGLMRGSKINSSISPSVKVSVSSSSAHEKLKGSVNQNSSLGEDSGFAEGRSKGQILYYDSDKLIQSIVDLTAINYIDCVNQKAPDLAESMDCDIEAGTTSDTGDILRKGNVESQSSQLVRDSNTEEQVTLPSRQNRSVGKKLTKLAKERKAAKTLGIVVGVFILCWLPFFVVNIIVALCGTNCIFQPQILLSIVTWLGWLNSAMNPVIYACWSRDFRRAFRRVLCTWVEFLCPYDGSRLAKKLNLKNSSNFSSHQYQEVHLNRVANSLKYNTSSTTVRTGVSLEGGTTRAKINSPTRANGTNSRSLLSDH